MTEKAVDCHPSPPGLVNGMGTSHLSGIIGGKLVRLVTKRDPVDRKPCYLEPGCKGLNDW